jgi:lysophospholipase L1-like esterase
VALALGAGLFAIVLGEILCRAVLGLGDPPLMVEDPKIEYLYAPSRSYHRFGKITQINSHHMRSEDFPATKSSPAEKRVLFLGDSIINGGSQTDQSELATTLLASRLSRELGAPVVVGNASAGSWGPENLLEYVRKFGIFDADVVVIVVSTHDSADVPTHERVVGVRPEFPDKAPYLAIQELFTRYLIPRVTASAGDPMPTGHAYPQQDVARATESFRQLLQELAKYGVKVIVTQHPEQVELFGKAGDGKKLLESIAREEGAEVIDLFPAYESSVRAGERPYRDAIHPAALGQRLMADELFAPILQALRSRPDDSPKSPG